jgi:DNA-binding NtrC family response regulator
LSFQDESAQQNGLGLKPCTLALDCSGSLLQVSCGQSESAFQERAARVGSFEHADGGTLLLDDIDDLPLEIQVKLLRVLQEGTIVRVGSTEEIAVNIRIVATTKVDLEEAAEANRFRPDLFYRLRGLELHLPPLRQRNEDILMLADHFLRLFSPAEGPLKGITPEAGQMLMRYPWPGNVRELRRAIESAIVLAGSGDITPLALPEFLQRQREGNGRFTLNLSECAEISLHDMMLDFEKELVKWGLEKAGGSQSKAAQILGIPRTTLQSKLGNN